LDSSAGSKRTFSSRTISPGSARPRRPRGPRADDVAGQRDGGVDQLAEAGGDRGQGVLGVHLALRATQVSHHDDRGTGLGELLQGRQRRLDPAVVGDRLAVQRDVEIAADQDALAPQISEIVDGSHLGTPFRIRVG
jgi:hypothetical protein